jgi:hypothetical protein
LFLSQKSFQLAEKRLRWVFSPSLPNSFVCPSVFSAASHTFLPVSFLLFFFDNIVTFRLLKVGEREREIEKIWERGWGRLCMQVQWLLAIEIVVNVLATISMLLAFALIKVLKAGALGGGGCACLLKKEGKRERKERWRMREGEEEGERRKRERKER